MASQAYVSDSIIINEPSQGISNWAAIITDAGSSTADINDTTPTTITAVTAFAPDSNSTAKIFSVGLFLTQAGATAYLAAHPGSLTSYGFYRPAGHN